MKRLMVSFVLVFLVLAGTAEAFHWHMNYGQAKHASKEFASEACKSDHKCTGYAVGPCVRVSDSRFDCEVGLFYAETPGPGEELECNIPLHWGVSHGGFLELKNHGSVHCFQV